MSEVGASRMAGVPAPSRLSFRGLASTLAAVLLSPWRLLRGLRRSLTGASTTLMLFLIVALNIIWGYPWAGMFAACVALMFVGWLGNRLLLPRLRLGLRIPSSAPAGETFGVRQHLENRGWLPAMDLRVRFATGRDGRPGEHAGAPKQVALIRPGERIELSSFLRFESRGIHPIPDVIVESYFPFHLYRGTRRIASGAEIAITPRLLTADDEPQLRGVLAAASGWARQRLSGESLDYVGSREYQIGMPVRRWDFASWARLGRPIVREFTTPSVQTLAIAVDTALPDARGRQSRREGLRLFERLLSLVATLMSELARGNVCLRVLVTSAGDSAAGQAGVVVASPGDLEPLLIRLAEAQPVTAELAERQLAEFVETASSQGLLVFTTRQLPPLGEATSARVSVFRVDPPEQPAAARRAGGSTLGRSPAAEPAVSAADSERPGVRRAGSEAAPKRAAS